MNLFLRKFTALCQHITYSYCVQKQKEKKRKKVRIIELTLIFHAVSGVRVFLS